LSASRLLAHHSSSLVPSATSVVLAPVAALFRNERGRDDLAVDLELEEPPREPEAARPGFIADAQLAPLRLRALELAHEFFQRVQIVGDRARERTSRSPLPSATASEIVSLWTSNPTKRIGLPLRLSVDGFCTREHRTRLGDCVFTGSTRTCFGATRGSVSAAGKRPFLFAETGGVTEGTQP
jgi:hypothetical protein